jgi:hypothetical protein
MKRQTEETIMYQRHVEIYITVGSTVKHTEYSSQRVYLLYSMNYSSRVWWLFGHETSKLELRTRYTQYVLFVGLRSRLQSAP